MCLYPRLLKNRKYTKTKKNGGNIPPVTDQRVLYVPVGCGNCIECKKQKARNWQVRLLEDIKTNKNGKFITLTFSNESLCELQKHTRLKSLNGYQLDNETATLAMRLFLERWRKKYKKSLRHWLITELGHNGTENIHLHGIIWTDIELNEVEKIWQYGWVWKGKIVKGQIQNYVNNKTINYIIKYVTKIDLIHREYNSKILTSKGIGNKYTASTDAQKNKFNKTQTVETYKTQTGHEINLPIYYRNKIYTETQREQLWLQKLDKNERWVLGQKIKANDIKKYENLLKSARELNKQLGYGNDEKNWDREEYENNRRQLQNEKRLQNAKNKAPARPTHTP